MSLLIKRMAVSGIATDLTNGLISNPYLAVVVPKAFGRGGINRLDGT
jgi:hypothetical protein